jgi:hypothetical protein
MATTINELQCDGAISDQILTAARDSMPADPGRWFADRKAIEALPEKQRPLLPLLLGLLDATESTARAINDNAWDDLAPLDRSLIKGITEQLQTIKEVIEGANDPPAAYDYSLPSMSGKELV